MAVKNSMQFFKEVQSELAKIVWPKPDEFIGSTIIVLLLVCAAAIFLGAVDLGFAKLAKYIFKLYVGY
jgi:preprotein translocase subunit SecE